VVRPQSGDGDDAPGKVSATKTIRVRVRNADVAEAVGHPVELDVDDSDCGGVVAGTRRSPRPACRTRL